MGVLLNTIILFYSFSLFCNGFFHIRKNGIITSKVVFLDILVIQISILFIVSELYQNGFTWRLKIMVPGVNK